MTYNPYPTEKKDTYTPYLEQPTPPPPPVTGADSQFTEVSAGVAPSTMPESDIPFGAISVDGNGNPYYGTGLLGWIRETYADLFDPKKRFANLDMSAEDWQAVEKYKATSATQAAEGVTGQDNQFLGLSTDEIAQAITSLTAPVQVAEKNDKSVAGTVVAGTANMTRDLLQRTAWGALSLIGITDEGVRKVVAFGTALDDVSKQVTEKSVLPEIFGHRNSTENAAIVAIALAQDKIQWSDVKGELNVHMKASAMAYTMVFNSEKRKLFEKAMAEGRDGVPEAELPGILAQEMADPLTELAGSIFFDPMTYLGMGIPVLSKVGKYDEVLETARFLGVKLPWRISGRIPTFGDILHAGGINIGKHRIQAKWASRLFEPASKDISNMLEKGVNAGNDADLLKIIDEGVPKSVRAIMDRELVGDSAEIIARRKKASASWFTTSSLRNTDKASIAARDMQLIVGNLVDTVGIDKAINASRDVRILFGRAASEADRVAAMKRLLTLSNTTKDFRGMLFSPAAYQMGAFLSRTPENLLADIFAKYGNDPAQLGHILFKHFDEVANEVIPSVNDMAKAAKDLKALKAVKPGSSKVIENIEKTERLAAMYADVPAWVKATTGIANKLNLVHGPVVGAQVNVYMKASPGYYVRGLSGQGMLIAMEMGVGRAAQITAKAAANATTDKSLQYVARRAEQLADLGVTVPADFGKGIGGVSDIKQGGATALAQNSERVAGAEIIYLSVLEEIRKAGPAVARKALDKLVETGQIIKRDADLLMGYFNKFDYNEKKAIDAWRKTISTKFVNDWQEIPITGTFRDILTRNGWLDEVQKIQQEAKSAEEFLQRTDEILENIRETATKAVKNEGVALGENIKSLDEKTVEDFVSIGEQAEKSGDDLLQAVLDDFGARIQAYGNMRLELEKADRGLLVIAAQMAERNPELAPHLDQLQIAASASKDEFAKLMHGKNAVRDALWKINAESHNVDNLTDLWNRATIGDTFSLSKMYPNVDPATLTQSEFRSYMWTAYTEWNEVLWQNGNNTYYDGVIKAYEGFFKTGKTSLQDVINSRLGNIHELFGNLEKAREITKAWEAAGFVDPTIRKMLRNLPSDAKLSNVTWSSFENAFGFNVKRVFNSVNADRRAKGLAEYATFGDVPFREGVAAAMKRTQAPIPLPYNGGNPTNARAWYESLPKIEEEFKSFQGDVTRNFNKVSPLDDLTPEAEQVLSDFAGTFSEQMSLIRSKAVAWGVARRDFLLFDYRKSYLDLAHAYIKPFGYWTNQAYKTSFELLLANPSYAAKYMAWKQYNAREHSELPAWWRESVGLNLPGISDNPLFLNLEQNVNPIYSLTGVDFDDPRKRVDWLSSFVDDINKTGGALSTPINWAVAAYLYGIGEEDAARRWRGRALPQTRFIKSLANLDIAGTNFLELIGADESKIQAIRYGEFDPFVGLLDKGVDAYEEGYVANALAAWVEEGATEEEKLDRSARAIDAVYEKDGDLYDYGVERAIDKRAPGAVMSFFGGPGFKVRTEADARLDAFYNQFYQLVQARDLMDAEQYRAAWDVMRDKYPEMDVLLIGKKGSDDRDAAFAYNVLGRVPPGDLSLVFELVGIDQARVDWFYENKGDLSGLGQGEKDHFMSGVVMLAAVLKMPAASDRQGWTEAKSMYRSVEEEVSKQLGMPYEGDGRGIWDFVNAYYDVLETDKKAAEALKELYPIQEALDLKRAYISNTPELYKYYGSLDTLEAYYQSKSRASLTKRFGEDIYELSVTYTLLKDRASKGYYVDGIVPPGAKAEFEAFKKQYGKKLEQFWKAKDAYSQWVDRAVVTIGAQMPDREPIELRPGLDTQTQQFIAGEINAPQGVTAEEILASDRMRPELIELVQLYFAGNELPSVAARRLDSIAEQFGLTTAELLQILGVYFTTQ